MEDGPPAEPSAALGAPGPASSSGGLWLDGFPEGAELAALSAAAGCEVRLEPAVGPACRVRDGLFRLVGEAGEDLGYVHLHGGDVPEAPANGHGEPGHGHHGDSRAPAGDVAGVGSGRSAYDGSLPPQCRTNELYYTQIIYAVPVDRPNLHAASLPLIRLAVDIMNKQFDEDAVASGSTASLIVNCDALGLVDVPGHVLPTPAASSTFSSIRANLMAQGHNDPKVKYLVYFDDATAFSFAAGMGQVMADDSGSAANLNNGNTGSPLYAQYYHRSSDAMTTIQRVFTHELGHTLGAIQSSAPNTSGAYHCNDGWSIMCYDDGGPFSGGYTTSACVDQPSTQFDCNQDDVFNRCPAPGAYLATNWNMGANYSRYFVFGPITTLPPVPTGLTAVPTMATVDLAWTPGTYCTTQTFEVHRSVGGGPMAFLAATAVPSYTDTPPACVPLAYAVKAVSPAGGTTALTAPVTTALTQPCVQLTMPYASAASPVLVCVGEPAPFLGGGYASVGPIDPAGYEWSFGDGTTLGPGPFPSPTHTYTAPATGLVVSFTVRYVDGRTDTATRQLDVVTTANSAGQSCDPTPTVALVGGSAAGPLRVCVGQPAAFTGAANPLYWDAPAALPFTWQFGDGTTLGPGTEASPVHAYTLPGLRTVTLLATYASGSTGQATIDVEVLATGTNAQGLACSPGPATLDVASGTWPERVCRLEPLQALGGAGPPYWAGLDAAPFQWSWGDGPPMPPGLDASPVHTYTATGVYTVQLVARYGDGAQATATRTVEVVATGYSSTGRACEPDFGLAGPALHYCPTRAVPFSASSPAYLFPLTAVAWSVDGGPFEPGPAERSILLPLGLHTVAVQGTYSTGLTVTRQMEVLVKPGCGTPRAQPDCYSVAGRLDVPVPGVLANDIPHDAALEGAVLVQPPRLASAFQLRTDGSFVYDPMPGFAGVDRFTYSAIEGPRLSAPVEVCLYIQAPSGQSPPTPDFSVALDGREVTLQDRSRDDDGSPVAWTWELGDGAVASGSSVRHAYDAPGTYTVTLWVRDDSGLRAVAVRDVTVA